eukprot:7415008-Heterocapsa_arctica.AAC.1
MACEDSLRGVSQELTWLEKFEAGKGPSLGNPREESNPIKWCGVSPHAFQNCSPESKGRRGRIATGPPHRLRTSRWRGSREPKFRRAAGSPAYRT